MAYEVIDRTLVSPSGARQWLILRDGNFYIASAVNVPYSGPEVLIFPSDHRGEVTEYLEVYGERDTLNHEQVIFNWLRGA